MQSPLVPVWCEGGHRVHESIFHEDLAATVVVLEVLRLLVDATTLACFPLPVGGCVANVGLDGDLAHQCRVVYGVLVVVGCESFLSAVCHCLVEVVVLMMSS